MAFPFFTPRRASLRSFDLTGLSGTPLGLTLVGLSLLGLTLGSVACTRATTAPTDATAPPVSTPASNTTGDAMDPSREASADDEAAAKSELQQEFDAFVAERNSCSSSAECTLVSPGCPLGCGTGVRSEHAAAVQDKAAALIAEAERERGACAYRCAAMHVECVEARCTAVVE